MTALEALLSESNDSEIAQALTAGFDWLVALPPLSDRGDPRQPMLPPEGALGIFVGVRALVRTGQGAGAWAFIETALDAYASAHPRGRRVYVRHSLLGDAITAYPNLRLVVVEALLADRQWQDAAAALGDLEREIRGRDLGDAFTHEALGSLADLAKRHRLGPVVLEPGWVLARQRDLISTGLLDEAKADTWSTYASFLVNALKAGDVEEAAAFVDAKAHVAWPIEDEDHYGFNVVCVLAHAGRIDDAIGGIRDLVRRGYDMLWRFDRAKAEDMWWTKAMGQLEWLAPLEDVPAYEHLRSRYMTPQPRLREGPQPGPFGSIELMTLTGRARKRCALTRKLIAPGDPVYRFRPFRSGAPDPDIVAREAFDASDLAPWYRKHIADGYEPADFEPSAPLHAGQRFGAPAAAAFLFDLIEGQDFDVDAFISCIGRPVVYPMRLEWVRGEFDYWPLSEDGPFANDAHAGDYVNLTWVMLRCGFGPMIFPRLSEIDPATADPIFAMLSTFDRDDCREAARAHFGLDDLPDIIDMAFQSRTSLVDMLKLAAFGRDHPRFASAIAQALANYNLHIYSNTHPQVDWYLDDLQRYALAKSGKLTFLFIHTPERVPVLQTMLDNRWLVKGVGSGGYDGYENTGHFLYQAAVINRLLKAPEELSFWLETPWIERYVRGPTLRTVRHDVTAYLKRQPKQ